jgi:hypothetical protein
MGTAPSPPCRIATSHENIRSKIDEIRSLDFGCERAMFQKYGKTWLGFAGDLPFAAYAVNACTRE